MAQALNMGDEVHNRNAAATALLFKRLAPALFEADVPREDAAATLAFIAGNDHFFLNLSMAACKAMLDAAAGVAGSSMVTAMARNGVNFGIRLSGTGDAWFEAPANPVDGLYFPGYSIADAAADLGDSAITETAGVGGFAMAAAPAIVKFVGGTPADAMHHSLRMRAITLGANPSFTLPALDFAAAAAGIDARKVVDCGVLPVINSGIAHREAGVGQIGAGVTTAPMACFTAAVKALARKWRDARPEPARPPKVSARSAGSAKRQGDIASHSPWSPSAATRSSATTQHTALDDQYDAVCATAAHVVDMIAAGWNVVLTHGNGPQVGFILRRSEIADGQVPDGAGPLRGRRHAGRDRLHVPERDGQRAEAPRHRQAGRHAGHADAGRSSRSGVRAARTSRSARS